MSHERLKILKIEKSDFETYEKSPNPTCLREKTINPKLQPACFSLVHIKVQRNGTFHPKNIQLKNGFKRCICDCEFTTQRVPERKVKIQNISFINKISLPIIESHFALTPNRNLKPDNFYLLFFSSFV